MMPTYDYKCSRCSHKWEVFESMMIDPVRECPKCKGEATRQIGLGGGVVHKGEDKPPGEAYRRWREDREIQRKVRKAKKLKREGRVPKEEVLRLESRELNEDY